MNNPNTQCYIRWWKGLYGFGRVFFQAPDKKAAHTFMQKWGADFALGPPGTIKSCHHGEVNPKDLRTRAFVFDRGVWIEQ